MNTPLLTVSGLNVDFTQGQGGTRVVEDVSFQVNSTSIVGVVGESGSGKSVTARAIAGILPGNGTSSGSVVFQDRELVNLSPRPARAARRGMSMIFQNPRMALDPVFTIGSQLTETLRLKQDLSRRSARSQSAELLAAVGIPEPRRRLDDYPHMMSGGMAQRVMIALSLACSPDLLIADEPTSALDVSVQAQILELLKRLRDEIGTAIVFISHDLGAVAELCDDIVVMYNGHVVELGPAAEVIRSPRHPYTEGLLNAVPRLRDSPIGREELPFNGIPITVTKSSLPSTGCNFAHRCRSAADECRTETVLRPVGPARETRCTRSEPIFSEAT
ncbi:MULTISPECIES: ABC transporter ATP-binding protein [Rhodococcus]|uniref:ABC transporter ATP-binding protein n=1 Tax=Rhodococcus oxybenzonivorans TaxID=1990687 RepID=A0AAE4UVX7_9NOCA|nr:MULTISPECIES: ABC transporter ATP-binding protein [Rhodococcus]MDV7243347.1 ABC transporter ATP-binding protein [Rhodococcus oxybenzonivorans]MDV7263951.1 ABC transporter ATP-binding protein [Rhodococcus oxybenzonivorans]MDV7276775.1 ABC transporter ATP-binding protein [Rhodococcus oxybenzonivorans]MDV7334393.1 ABC transporter ATP-binding protein [Rhodococcus oxybenzonivorans]MDV7344548.1 ABC transporter ATP-binding protein [Rhodococcus oxybenzonivorans]